MPWRREMQQDNTPHSATGGRSGLPVRRRLVISSLIGVVPLIILGLALLLELYIVFRDFNLKTNLSEARLAAAYTEGWLEGQIRTLRTLAQSNEVQRGTLADKRGLAARQIDAQADWESLWVTDAAGHKIVDTSGKLDDISLEAYFQQTSETSQPAISSIYIKHEQPFIVVAYPIMSDGQFRGIVAAGINPEEIRRLFSHVELRKSGAVELWGKDQRLIARTNTPVSELGQRYPVVDKDLIFSGESNTLIATNSTTHQRMLIGHAPVKIAGWTVISTVPVMATLTPVSMTLVLFCLLGLLLLAITLSWSLYSANIIGGQVARLAQRANEIGGGNHGARVDFLVDGELEQLSTSLNGLATDLQETSRFRANLLSLISHELKTPLTSIRTSLEMVSSGMVPATHPRFQELLDIADRQSRRLQDLIENLISVARLEAGGLSITPRITRLSAIIDLSVHQYADVAEARGLTFEVDVPEGLRVQADPAKVNLAVNNLLDNAVKFSENGNITIRAHAEETMAIVSVTDHGSGMTPEVKAQLLEQFHQPEPLLTRKAGGAGLGLFVTRAIIEAHGGEISVESAGTGTGSTFSFTIPLA